MTYKFTDTTNLVVSDDNGWSGLVTVPEVQDWIAQGNTPEPADIPDPKEAIKAQIASLEQAQLMPRATREFMLLFVETNNLTAMPGYAPLKAFDDQIKALRDQLA